MYKKILIQLFLFSLFLFLSIFFYYKYFDKESQIVEDRDWILNYVRDNISSMDEKNIIILNTARSCLKATENEKERKMIWSKLNNEIDLK